jgi:hypothetical protein
MINEDANAISSCSHGIKNAREDLPKGQWSQQVNGTRE